MKFETHVPHGHVLGKQAPQTTARGTKRTEHNATSKILKFLASQSKPIATGRPHQEATQRQRTLLAAHRPPRPRRRGSSSSSSSPPVACRCRLPAAIALALVWPLHPLLLVVIVVAAAAFLGATFLLSFALAFAFRPSPSPFAIAHLPLPISRCPSLLTSPLAVAPRHRPLPSREGD